MKLVIASDIHGAADACARLMSAIEAESPDRVVLLGDLLYRGNCEAEVDQMVLAFPCMADHNVLLDPGAEGGPYTLFLTHGHVYGPGYHNSVDSWPALPPRSALVYGHTHIKVSEKDAEHGAWVFNPGSAGIPKDGSTSYGVYESGRFEHRML